LALTKFDYTGIEIIIQFGGLCFSHNILQKIIKKITNSGAEKKILVYGGPRMDKKMYSCEIEGFGKAEFTDDHIFIYNNQVVTFEELIKLDETITKVRKIPSSEIREIYNIIGGQEQISLENVFEINSKILCVGCRAKTEIAKKYIEENINI